MAKHIHIHLAPGMRVTGARTGDAGNWDESKHKRADDGKFGSGGGGKAAPAKSAPSKSKAPAAPNLPGPKAQAAIKAIQAAASKGDWRAVSNVNTLGAHPQVTNYRNEMAKHVEGGGKALTEAVGKPDPGKEAQRGAQAKQTEKLKGYHKADAAGLKRNLGANLASGDVEGDNGKPLTYGDVKAHLATMRGQLKGDDAKHIEAATYALNQSFQPDSKPLKPDHAKNIGAALQGKAKANEHGQVKAAPTGGDKPPTSLVHGGTKHTATGKTGKTPSGETSHEYEAVDNEGRRTGSRVWRTASGKVIPD